MKDNTYWRRVMIVSTLKEQPQHRRTAGSRDSYENNDLANAESVHGDVNMNEDGKRIGFGPVTEETKYRFRSTKKSSGFVALPKRKPHGSMQGSGDSKSGDSTHQERV